MGLLSWFTGKPRASGDPDVNLASPAFKADPYPFYARLRAESPVFRFRIPDGQTAYLLTRYEDVATALKDDRFVKDKLNALSAGQLARQPWVPPVFKPLIRNMLDVDPPDHTRLRSLVTKAFSPRLVEGMRPRIESLTAGLLDGVRRKGRMDLIRDYALPLPTTIIAEMLGVPVADRDRFHRWSNDIVSASSSAWGLLWATPSVWLFLRYLRKLLRARRAQPRDDLLSALVQAEVDGAGLSEDDLLAMSFLLLVAGHETTVNLIGNGMLALMEHPEQFRRLRDEPALIRPAVEEMLRYASPVEIATERYTREEVTVAGVTIPKGSLVLAGIASANRDERQFRDPDRFDIGRDPNRHLAFGLGVHFCLGAPLARLEGQIAIDALMRTLPRLRLAKSPDTLRWRRGLIVRGVEALPVKFDK